VKTAADGEHPTVPPEPSSQATENGSIAGVVRPRSVKSCRLTPTSLEKARTARSFGTRSK
jgi:hypothetical protein